jgi:hypothetical protein
MNSPSIVVAPHSPSAERPQPRRDLAAPAFQCLRSAGILPADFPSNPETKTSSA